MNRKPTAATTFARPRREFANGANGRPVGPGVDRADAAGGGAQNATFHGLTPIFDKTAPLPRRRRAPQIARRYARAVRAELAQQVQSIVLFGSQARGDARPGSDFDFVVVLDRIDRVARDKVSAAGAELLNETNRLCSALIYSPEQWDMVRQSPLGWNVVREGIVL